MIGHVDVELQHGMSCMLHIDQLQGIAFSCFYLVGQMSITYTMPICPVEKCVTVEDKHGVVIIEHIKGHLTILLRTEHTLVAGSEMLQVHTGCKSGVATIVQMERFRETDGNGRQSLHSLIIPVVGLQSRTPIVGEYLVEHACGHFFSCPGASLYEWYIWQILADTL